MRAATPRCEWNGKCRRKATHVGFHWSKRFGLCADDARKARRYYIVEKLS